MRAHLWTAVSAGGLLMIGVYFLMPGVDSYDVYYATFGVLAVGAMVLGLWRNRPQPLLPYLLFVAGLALMLTGDTVWSWYEVVLRAEAPYPSVADAFYLMAYPTLFAGTRLLVRDARDRRGVGLEAWIIASGAAVVIWQLFMVPVVKESSGSLLANLVSAAYPAVDILLVAMVVRLLLLGLWRNTSLLLIGASFTAGLVADTIYGLQTLSGTYVTGVWYDAGWLFEYGLLGIALLHPSVRHVTSAVRANVPVLLSRRLVALAVAGLVAPVVLAVETLRGGTPDLLAVTGIWAVMFVLVVIRIRGLMVTLDSLLEQMRHRAHHDSLTGLANRASFTDLIEAALRVHDPELTVAYLDLNGFKRVNDTEGHLAGDALLVTVAERLRGSMRGRDVVARIGGDEFAVFSPGVHTDEQAMMIRDRLAAAMSEPFGVDGGVVPLSAAIGIARARRGESFDDLMARADEAMYRAKRHSGEADPVPVAVTPAPTAR